MSRHRFLSFFVILGPITLGLLLAVPATRADEYSHARIVRLSLVEGDVQSTNPGDASWQKAVANLPLREGMSIATGQGRAEIEFESGATARIADNSVLQFTELGLSEGNRITRLELSQGTISIYNDRERHAGRDRFEVQAGKLLIKAPENSRFRVDVFEDGASVSALKGDLEVETAGGSQRVAKGQTLALRSDATDQIVLEHNPQTDAWDRWVSQRQDAIDDGRYSATQYVNAPVNYGIADLAFYGGWYNYPGYGNCWQPFGVGLGWSPYYNGTWSYVPGYGFTWVSYEPWGWMPFHYGSWVFSPALGWLWVPGYFNAWDPGAVYWYRQPGVLGWIPRGPHDHPGNPPQNLTTGVITNTPAGIGVGQPNRHGVLTAGAAPQFFTDTRGERDLWSEIRQARTAQLTSGTALAASRLGAEHAALNPTASSAGARWTPGTPRKMSEREIKTTHGEVYTVVPNLPAGRHGYWGPTGTTGGGAAGGSSQPSHGGRGFPSSRGSSGASAPRPAPMPHPSPSGGRPSHP